MITVLITYTLPSAPPRTAILEKFVEAANAKFKGLPGLFSKQFCYDESTGNGHSVYLWESKEQAEAFFSSPAFVEGFEKDFGAALNVTYLDTLVVVDNRVGDVTSNA